MFVLCMPLRWLQGEVECERDPALLLLSHPLLPFPAGVHMCVIAWGGLMVACDLSEHSSHWTAESNASYPLLPFPPAGVQGAW